MDVLNFVAVLVLIVLLLCNMFMSRAPILFGDELPAWDKRA